MLDLTLFGTQNALENGVSLWRWPNLLDIKTLHHSATNAEYVTQLCIGRLFFLVYMYCEAAFDFIITKSRQSPKGKHQEKRNT